MTLPGPRPRMWVGSREVARAQVFADTRRADAQAGPQAKMVPRVRARPGTSATGPGGQPRPTRQRPVELQHRGSEAGDRPPGKNRMAARRTCLLTAPPCPSSRDHPAPIGPPEASEGRPTVSPLSSQRPGSATGRQGFCRCACRLWPTPSCLGDGLPMAFSEAVPQGPRGPAGRGDLGPGQPHAGGRRGIERRPGHADESSRCAGRAARDGRSGDEFEPRRARVADCGPGPGGLRDGVC